MNLRSGKRLPICSEEHKKQRLLTPPCLPDELIINDILMRLPAKTLAICSCVSKLWYNSIFHDPNFVSSHLVHNKNKLNLVFTLLNAFEKDWQNYFFSIGGKTRIRMLVNVTCGATSELVGYCNGLACLKSESSDASADDESEITIINPTRGETLSFYSYSTPTMGCKYLCHGFGFDSALQEYKAVFVYTNINEEEEEEFVCMVITLGGEDLSWRKIVTSTSRISPPPGSSPFPSRMFTRASTFTRKSGTLCGSGLFWRITNRASKNKDFDMLLSFDIHNEKINFIRLPVECCLTHTTETTAIDKHEYLVVDHHLLEFQGDLCVARTEKTLIENSSDGHQQHRNHRCKGSSKETFCCCGFKVHLYIMNDKVKQVWTKGKTFDLPLKDGLMPYPSCCYFDDTFVTPPTRMLSYSDQLLLYWFDGPYLIIYSLQMERLEVVKCLSSRDQGIHFIFYTKEKTVFRSPPGRHLGRGGNKHFPYMDYQLHGQVENIISLKKFIPEGLQACTFSCHSDFE